MGFAAPKAAGANANGIKAGNMVRGANVSIKFLFLFLLIISLGSAAFTIVWQLQMSERRKMAIIGFAR